MAPKEAIVCVWFLTYYFKSNESKKLNFLSSFVCDARNDDWTIMLVHG